MHKSSRSSAVLLLAVCALLAACGTPASARRLRQEAVPDESVVVAAGAAVPAAAGIPAVPAVAAAEGGVRAKSLGGRWLATSRTSGAIQPGKTVRVTSPTCPAGQQAIGCAPYSPFINVHAYTSYPTIGVVTDGANAASCFCDFVNSGTTATSGQHPFGLRCSVYCI